MIFINLLNISFPGETMAEETKKKVKRPTAEKRMIQNEKKRLANRMFKSRVRTAIRTFESTLKSGDKDTADKDLNLIYSLMDKGVKKGIYKKNKAANTKSRFSSLAKSA